MTWVDYNQQGERVALGGKLVRVIGVVWLCFTVGVFLAVSLFWDETLYAPPGPGLFDMSPIRDGSDTDRWAWCIWASLPGVFAAAWIVIRRGAKDMARQALELQEKQKVAQELVAQAKEKKTDYLKPIRQEGFSGLTLGVSTGFLNRRGHFASMPQGTTAHLPPADLCKNVIILGGTGGGKTTRLINPCLQQIVSQDCSALIFDIKGDYRHEVEFISGQVGRAVRVLGDGGMTINLFRGCTPEVAASYLKSCFIASGSASGDGAFFAETATNFCRNLLSLIKLAQSDYSIAGLADLVFSEKKRMEALMLARSREESGDMNAKDVRVWNAVAGYMVDTVAKWDDKFRGNVLGTCEAVLNPFLSPDLVDAFSIESEHGEADLYDLLNKPEIFLVNLPSHKFGNAGARFAYLLIKLRFMTMMAERRSRPDVNQSRYVAFFCDEYQGIVDSVSDTGFWDKSRSSKCFGILSMQGFSSLVQAVGGQQAANAIFQNWRQRVITRTEDMATIEMVQRTLGQVDVEIESYSENAGTSDSVSTSNSMSSGGPGNSTSYSQGVSQSQGRSTTIQKQGLFEANEMRMLDADYAIFLGNVGDKAVDDVIEISPLYVPDPVAHKEIAK